MINLSLSLYNPFSTTKWESLYEAYGSITKNKAWEFQIERSKVLLSLLLSITFRQSHAGIEMGAGLLGRYFYFVIYDTRHWDHEEGRWQQYEEKVV